MVSLRLLLLFEFNWLYASFPLAIAIALANIREHLCSFTCTLIRKRLFIYSSHAIQLNGKSSERVWKSEIFSNISMEHWTHFNFDRIRISLIYGNRSKFANGPCHWKYMKKNSIETLLRLMSKCNGKKVLFQTPVWHDKNCK